MDKPRPGLLTFNTFGMDLPIIADLGDWWFLVAHPNGAAIANKHSMASLSFSSAETHIPDVTGLGSDIPEAVRAKAVEEFEKLAWPLVRNQFFDSPKRKRQMHQVTFKFQAGDLVCTANGRRGIVISCVEEYGSIGYWVETSHGRSPYSEPQLRLDTTLEE